MGTGASTKIAEKVRHKALSYAEGREKRQAARGKPLWARVRECGSELWLDTGDIEEASALWCSEFSALTTNNTLLNKEVQKGIYDALIAEAAAELSGELSAEELTLEIAFVLNAVHALRLSERFDARVSVELHTDLANDVERTVAYARRYREIAPDRFIIKVPLAPAGLLAARQISDDGIPVNYTLGFSARQNYLITTISRPAFVNVFLGRLNAFVADNGLGGGEFVGEKALLASQRVVSELREELGVGTRQIGASLRAREQVGLLTGVDVLTMPTKVARGFEEINPPLEGIASRVEAELDVELAPEVDREALGIECLWDVPPDFRGAVRDLAGKDPRALKPEDIVGFFADRGYPDFLPRWSEGDIETVSADGKIPVYKHWKGRMARREVSLDALLNISGLRSFAADQEAMDERILSML